VIARSTKEARFLAQIAQFNALILGICTMLVVVFYQQEITDYFNTPQLYPWAYLLPMSIVIGSWMQTYTFWNNRQNKFKPGAVSKIIQTLTQSASQICLSPLLPTGGLIIGRLTGTLIAFISLRSMSHTTVPTAKLKYFRIYRRLFHKYRNYPTIGLLGSTSNNLATQLPIIAVTKHFGLSDLGIFTLAIKTLSLPSRLISASITTALKNEVVKDFENNSTRLKKTLLKLLTFNTAIYFPIFIIIFLYASIIFETTFGSDWKTAGEIAEILVISSYLRFIISPLSAIFSINQNLKIGVSWQISYLIVMALVLFLNPATNINSFTKIYVCTDALMYLIYLLLIIHTIRKKNKTNV